MFNRLNDPRYAHLIASPAGQAIVGEVQAWTHQTRAAAHAAAGEKQADKVVRYVKSQLSFYNSYVKRGDEAGMQRSRDGIAKHINDHMADLAGASSMQHQQLSQYCATLGIAAPLPAAASQVVSVQDEADAPQAPVAVAAAAAVDGFDASTVRRPTLRVTGSGGSPLPTASGTSLDCVDSGPNARPPPSNRGVDPPAPASESLRNLCTHPPQRRIRVS